MIVNKSKLSQIMFVNCIVNLVADGEVLKYRYKRSWNKDNISEHVWFCNDVNTGMQVIELIKQITTKYKHIEVKYKKMM